MTEREKAIEKAAKKAPKLNLEIINSTVLEKGVELKIGPYGLEKSLRNKKDGFVYFGSFNDIDYPLNDFLITSGDQNDIRNK